MAVKDDESKKDDGTRGAVLVEFVITIVPVLMMTFGWLQLSWLYTANLLVKRSANACVRAAVVIDNSTGINPGKQGTEEDVDRAAEMAANPEPGRKTFSHLECNWHVEADETNPFGTVTATVTADYDCNVPMGRYIICGADSTKTLTKVSKMPMQGARYADE